MDFKRFFITSLRQSVKTTIRILNEIIYDNPTIANIHHLPDGAEPYQQYVLYELCDEEGG